MKNIIFAALLTLTFSAQASEKAQVNENLIAKKPTDAQILQFKILKAFKEKRTFYKA